MKINVFQFSLSNISINFFMLDKSCNSIIEAPSRVNQDSKKIIKPNISTRRTKSTFLPNKAVIGIEFSNSDDPFVISDSENETIEDPTKNFCSQKNFSESISQSNYVIYRCRKIKKFKFGRRQFVFNLTDANSRDTIIYTSKYQKSSINPIISIFEGKNSDLNENFADAVILTSDNLNNFSLRKKSRYGNEMMSLKFIKSVSNVKKPRSIQIYASIDPEYSKPIFFRNLEPKKNVFGIWQLDLNAENVFSSSKNCRIINNSTKETAFIIRKVEKHVIEIEGLKCFNILQLFALSISSFLCNIK